MGCEVVLVRHGESVIPVPGGPGDFERGLTGHGLAQAERLAAELAEFEPAGVVSSPYLRAVQTIEPAARRLGLPVTVDSALREWDSGLKPRPDFVEHYARSWADLGFARPGGESLAELSVRAVSSLTALAGAHDGGVVVVGSHGTFICRALAGFGVHVDWPFSRAMPMPAVYRLSLGDHRARAVGPGL